MVPKILIVDDDASQLRLMEKELENYTYFFAASYAASGQEALNTLASTDFALVISDLRMPGIDGFELLNRIIKQYPDIPVMVMTAYGRPKTREVVIKSGAVDYITKPVDGAGLFEGIMKVLKKKEEGGSLNKVSLETYLQLVEMEEQTCTLRIREQSGSRMGVLFFKKGQLMEARIGNQRGQEAAYQILSWSGVSLSIENACVITEKIIDGELQAILLNAMRSKDENEENEEIILEPEKAVATDTSKKPDVQKRTDFKINKKSTEADFHEKKAVVSEEKLTPVQSAEKKIAALMNGKEGILDIYKDLNVGGLIFQVENIGQLFESGVLNVIYMIKNEDERILVVPDTENVVILLDNDVPREGLIASFV